MMLARVPRSLLGLPALAAFALTLSSCNGFFVRESSGGGGTTTGSGDYAYVSNSPTGSTYINGYTLSDGTLASITGSPFLLGITPSAMAITPANTFLYVAADPALYPGAVYAYSIGSDGSLTLANNKTAVATDDVSSMDISPDGQWLFALNTDGLTLEEYSINSSTGILSVVATYPIDTTGSGIVTPSQVKVSPTGQFVVCALGTGGSVVYTLDTTTGAAVEAAAITTGSTAIGDYGLSLDSNNYLYIARTSGVAVYALPANGAATAVAGAPFAAGAGPHSVVLSSGGGYLYAGNQTDGTLSEYTIGGTGGLTAVTGSPVTAPATVSTLARDNSGKYILATGYNSSSGLQMFTIGSTGALTLNSGSAGTGISTAIPAVIAVTH